MLSQMLVRDFGEILNMTTEEKLNELIDLIKYIIQVDDGIKANHANWILEQLDNLRED